MTQAALASRAGLHVGYVNALENTHQMPSLDTLERLAKGFRIDLRTLVDFPESGGRKSDRAKGEIAQIIGRLEHADLETLQKIRKVVEAMTG